jgi:hypothetical protein
LKEIVMNPIRHVRRLAAALTGLAGALLAFAAAPAAFAAMSVPPPGAESAGITPPPQPPGWNKHPHLPGQTAAAVAEHHESLTGGLPAPLAAHIHQQAPQAPGPGPIHAVVVASGMPGWQIALIAIGAALFAATAAVLLDRAWTARRRSATAAA